MELEEAACIELALIELEYDDPEAYEAALDSPRVQQAFEVLAYWEYQDNIQYEIETTGRHPEAISDEDWDTIYG